MRCGKWIIDSEVTVEDLVAKCGEPASKQIDTTEVQAQECQWRRHEAGGHHDDGTLASTIAVRAHSRWSSRSWMARSRASKRPSDGRRAGRASARHPFLCPARRPRHRSAAARADAAVAAVMACEFSPHALDLDALFARRAPRVLEIGFGNGENLAALAQAHPERDYLGIEVHRAGVGRLLLSVADGLADQCARHLPRRRRGARGAAAAQTRSMRC